MPKQYYTIRDWSGGINVRRDPRDLKENESPSIQNMSIDALGKIKTAGKLYAHKEDQDGSTDLSQYIVERTANLVGSGGFGLFYFESDHGRDANATITDTKMASSNDLTIGTGDGTILFNKVVTSPDGPYGPSEQEDSPR